jgi:photosystem II stability/assembly factor-like uncharacterized protein
MKTKLMYGVVGALLALLLFSCNPPIGGGAGEESGMLTIRFDATSIANRTILPDIDMSPAAYIVTGTGPDGASFEVETTDTSVVIEKLAFGDWTVVVEAKNSAEVIIGSGQADTTVHTGQTAVVDITVTPLEGYGTLDLTVTWPAADTDIPGVDAELIPAAGSAQALDFTVDAILGQAVYTSDAIQTGYHTLIVKLMDNGLLTMGAVEVVRIVKDGVSTGIIDFPEINKPGGNIQVNITPDMADPLEVSMSGQVAELSQGASMTVSASVTDDPGNVVYVWYINGESVGTGQTISVGSDLDIGVYRLDVTAFTADGRRAGSTSAMFHVVENIQQSGLVLLRTVNTVSGGTDNAHFGICTQETSVYVGTNVGLSISKDYGETWNNITAEDGLPGGMYRVSAKGNYIYVGSWDGLFVSDDDGISWAQSTADGITGICATDSAVYYGTDAVAYGLGISEDNGLSWRHISFGSAYEDNYVSAVYADDSVIYVGIRRGTLYISRDNGASFTSYLTNLPDQYIYKIQVHNGVIYVGRGAWLYYSHDDGQTWDYITTSAWDGGNLHDFYVDDKAIYVATWGGGLVYSEDYGQSWKKITSDDGLVSNHLQSVYSLGEYVYCSSGGLSILKWQ